MALTAQPTQPTTDAWREELADYRPPAGPDGCWASGTPGPAAEDAAPGDR